MNDLPVALQFVKRVPADPATGRVLTEHYDIIEKDAWQRVGAIRLRLSNAPDVLLYAGHIGYNVDPGFPGTALCGLRLSGT